MNFIILKLCIYYTKLVWSLINGLYYTFDENNSYEQNVSKESTSFQEANAECPRINTIRRIKRVYL